MICTRILTRHAATAILCFVASAATVGQLSAQEKRTNPPAEDQRVVTDKMTTELDLAIRDCMTTHGMPGAALVVVHDGKTVFKRGYGLADVERGTKVDPDKTIFRIGSISKALTLLTMTRMIDDGRLGLKQDASKLFDGIRNEYNFKKPITLENLLTHTSGFDQLGGMDRQIRNHDLPLAERKALRPSIKQYLKSNRLRRISPAGAYYRYDTYGTTLAGAIIEKVADMSYRDAMRQEMFSTLGMENTFVEADADQQSNLAVGYVPINGRNVAQPYEVYVTTPASSIDSTAADMGRLLEALTGSGANKHGRLFSEKTAAAVLEPQFRPHPEFLGTTHGLHESYEAGGPAGNAIRSVDHGGDMQGFKALMTILPKYKLGVFVVTNHNSGGRNVIAAASINAIAANLKSLPARTAYPIPKRVKNRDLSEFVGNFYYGVFCHNGTVDEYANGAWRRPAPRAVAQLAGALIISEQTFLPRGDDVFVREDGGQMVFFGRDNKRRITHYAYSSSADTFEKELEDRPHRVVQSLAQEVFNIATTRGIDSALRFFSENKQSENYYLRELEMNNVGYALLQRERVNDAIAVFKRNVLEFPDSWNAHDSLGDAYSRSGQSNLSIKSYEKSIELNPDNIAANAISKKLKSKK